MKRELFERDKQVVLSSISDTAKSLADTIDIGLYNIDELARLLVYGCDGEDDFLAIYRDARECFKERQSALIAHFCRAVCTYCAERGIELPLSRFFEAEDDGGARVAYVKNAISDEAYRAFSGVLENASVTYLPSFSAACEEVYYGRVPYCILPYENSEEGVLSGFMRLMHKYELYPHYVCSCRGENGTTGMALLGRFPCTKEENGLQMRVKVSFYSLDGAMLADVLAVAGAMNLQLIKTDSVPVSWDEGRYGGVVTLSADKESVIPFLIYLALEVPECSDKLVYYQLPDDD